jgi:amino acid adenylation domain-containing protein/non-ribosomal peptide synthase protein (TIGR01720 family)
MIEGSEAPAPAAAAFRLSAQQRRLWLAHGDQDGRAFRAECAVRIAGGLRPGRLREAFREVVGRDEILRTTFQRRRGIKVPFQVIAAAAADPEWLDEVAQESRPFDYESGPLLRASLREIGPRLHELRLELPSLCADGRSLANLVAEVAAVYAALTEGADLPAEPLQYADYADWQEEMQESAAGDAAPEPASWIPRDLGAAVASLRLPWQRDSQGAVFAPAAVASPLEPGLARGLEALAESRGVPLAVVLLAAWQLLLWRLTGRPEVVVGARFDGREAQDLAGSLGLFDWWAPVTGAFAAERSFEEILGQVAEAWQESAAWRPYLSGGGAEPVFFPAGFDLEELPGPYSVAGLTFTFVESRACFEPFAVKLAAKQVEGDLRLELWFDPAAVTGEAAMRLERQLQAVLRLIVLHPERGAGDFDIVAGEERERLIARLNATAVDFPGPVLVHQRFEAQAERDPGRIAVVSGDREISYGDLNARANRLARRLIELGVGPEARVGILLERSPEYLVALLATLKAGGAYVPFDPMYPRQRLERMLAEAGAAVLVTQRSLAGELRAEGVEIVVPGSDAAGAGEGSAGNPAARASGENLAYVLFTSGSTGAPKGVAVEHRQLANYVDAVLLRLDLPPGAPASYAAMSTFAADLGNTALFPSLCTGGCFHLVSQDLGTDADALARYAERHAVDCLKIVPTHLAALLGAAENPARVLPRRCLVLGGEAAAWELVSRIRQSAPGLRVINHYGPTEATVGATTYAVGERPTEPWAPAWVPLGLPLPNLSVYLLNERLQPVPAGVPGEAFLGGKGVARGYLGRPDLTAERFIPDPLGGAPGARLYRTGDLARFLPDGTVEFLGRIDHQVKIHGFRIEIGEIEAVLASHPAVGEAVVAVREDHPGDRRLSAYFVPRRGRTATTEELRAWLRQRLPDYMVPPTFVGLAALPLTPNGKVDRAALPAPERVPSRQGGAAHVPPRNAVEETLARIWAEVLGTEKVGIFDNFFELGGDSILSIEVIARANREGLRLNPRQVFQHQTLGELAAVAGTAPAREADRDLVHGEAPLTPIQHWFFERLPEDPHHWNQAILLEVPRGEAGVLARAVDLVLAHHDALRLRFERTASDWRQQHARLAPGASWTHIDLAGLPEELGGTAFVAAVAQVQASLDLVAGPLARVVFLDLAADRPARLLWVVHHLVVDGVSWRILLGDLAAAHRQLRDGDQPHLSPKTTSFKVWAERLALHARSYDWTAELQHWLQAAPAAVPALPVDFPSGANTVVSERTVSASLGPDETQALLHELPAAYRAQIDEALLAALATAVRRWTGSASLLVELEGHGREALFDDVDVSRTVGWFTSRFPVFLDLDGAAEPGAVLLAVKERLRSVPAGGIGYSLLRYLGGPEGTGELLSRPVPEIVFNYLGQLDHVLASEGPFRAAVEPAGPAVSPRGGRRCLLEVVARVAGGRLGVTWFYSENLHRRDTVERLAEVFLDELRSLIDHCRSSAGAVSPSDFPLASLDHDRLDRVLAALGKRGR